MGARESGVLGLLVGVAGGVVVVPPIVDVVPPIVVFDAEKLSELGSLGS
jgi:hypothetical protein